MNHITREKRIGLLSVVAALVLIAGWWLLLMPALSKYKVHRQEASLKDKLGSIKPPAGVKPGDISVTRLAQFGYISATRLDPATSDCVSGEMYYRNEFTNAGFGYDGEKLDPKQHTKTLSFAGQGYGASLICWELPGVQSDLHLYVYVIEMWSVR